MKIYNSIVFLFFLLITISVFSVDRAQRKFNARDVFTRGIEHIRKKFEKGRTGPKTRKRLVKKLSSRDEKYRYEDISRRSLAQLILHAKRRFERNEPLIK